MKDSGVGGKPVSGACVTENINSPEQASLPSTVAIARTQPIFWRVRIKVTSIIN